MSNNPYSTTDGNASGGLQAAKSKIAVPAIALIVDGVLTVIYALYAGLSGILVMAGMNPMVAAQQAQFDQMAANGQSAEQIEMIRNMSNMMAGPGGIVIALIALVCGLLIVWGRDQDEESSVARSGNDRCGAGDYSLYIGLLHHRLAVRHLGHRHDERSQRASSLPVTDSISNWRCRSFNHRQRSGSLDRVATDREMWEVNFGPSLAS